MSEDKLSNIQNLLEDIKGLLLIANQDKIEAIKTKLIKPNSTEESIYNLCDGTNTTKDIASKINKSVEYTGAVVSTLRQKGLVKTIEKDGKKINEQRF